MATIDPNYFSLPIELQTQILSYIPEEGAAIRAVCTRLAQIVADNPSIFIRKGDRVFGYKVFPTGSVPQIFYVEGILPDRVVLSQGVQIPFSKLKGRFCSLENHRVSEQKRDEIAKQLENHVENIRGILDKMHEQPVTMSNLKAQSLIEEFKEQKKLSYADVDKLYQSVLGCLMQSRKYLCEKKLGDLNIQACLLGGASEIQPLAHWMGIIVNPHLCRIASYSTVIAEQEMKHVQNS